MRTRGEENHLIDIVYIGGQFQPGPFCKSLDPGGVTQENEAAHILVIGKIKLFSGETPFEVSGHGKNPTGSGILFQNP